MTKKAQTLYVSFIPLILIIGLIFGAGYFLLADEIKLPSFKKDPEVRRLEGFPTVIYSEDVFEKQRKVIKTEDELNDFLNMVDPTGIATLKENIDFDKEHIIAISSETEVEVDHRIRVKKIRYDKDDEELIVLIHEFFPGDTCEIEEDPHIAVDLVAIEITDKLIDFDREKLVEECD